MVLLDISGEPGPITWKVRLANGKLDAPRQSLEIVGKYDRGASRGRPGPPRLRAELWPWAFGDDRGTISGQLDGELFGHKKRSAMAPRGRHVTCLAQRERPRPGRPNVWDRSGARRLEPQSDRPRLDDPRGRADHLAGFVQGPWEDHRAPDQVKLDGEAGWNGDLRARWSALGSFAMRDEITNVDARLELVQVLADSREGEGLSLQFKGSAPRDGRRIDLASLAVDSRFLQVSASGHIDDPAGNRFAYLGGTITPHWKVLSEWLGQNVEPRARIQGHDHPFQLRAALGKNLRDTLDGTIGLAIDEADIYGMKFGPTALVVRARQGKLSVDPIDTTVNDGRLHLEPLIRIGDASEPTAILLDRAAQRLTDSARVQRRGFGDACSRFLWSRCSIMRRAFAARSPRRSPRRFFRSATWRRRRLQDRRLRARWCFRTWNSSLARCSMACSLLTGRADRPALRLDEPVALRIADRRVYQRGLAVPIGKLTKFELEGSVGFDRSLDLIASMPILPTMLADRPLLGAIAADARIRVPIRGTLQKPEIDSEAFKIGMNDLGRSLLEGGGIRAAVGFIERLTRPRDPNASARHRPPRNAASVARSRTSGR